MTQDSGFYAATVSAALMIAFAGDVDEPARAAVLPKPAYVPARPIRPVAEAIAIAFCS